MNSNEYVIIVAGGSGSRMETITPKQFLVLDDKPILMHTILAFRNYSASIKIIIVLPHNQLGLWNELCSTYQFNEEIELVTGGITRFQSVKNGLAKLPTNGLVAIHDGVRPFISYAIIKESFEEAAKQGNAVVAVALKDSIREIKGNGSLARNRDNYRLVQTPQTFKVALLKEAYDVDYCDDFTDDASVFEKSKARINLIQGSFDNIKITTKVDLVMAESFLRSKKNGHN